MLLIPHNSQICANGRDSRVTVAMHSNFSENKKARWNAGFQEKYNKKDRGPF